MSLAFVLQQLQVMIIHSLLHLPIVIPLHRLLFVVFVILESLYRGLRCPYRCLGELKCGGEWIMQRQDRCGCCERGVRDWEGGMLHWHSMYPDSKEGGVGSSML